MIQNVRVGSAVIGNDGGQFVHLSEICSPVIDNMHFDNTPTLMQTVKCSADLVILVK